jgi:hypothetical protein
MIPIESENFWRDSTSPGAKSRGFSRTVSSNELMLHVLDTAWIQAGRTPACTANTSLRPIVRADGSFAVKLSLYPPDAPRRTGGI